MTLTDTLHGKMLLPKFRQMVNDRPVCTNTNFHSHNYFTLKTVKWVKSMINFFSEWRKMKHDKTEDNKTDPFGLLHR